MKLRSSGKLKGCIVEEFVCGYNNFIITKENWRGNPLILFEYQLCMNRFSEAYQKELKSSGIWVGVSATPFYLKRGI